MRRLPLLDAEAERVGAGGRAAGVAHEDSTGPPRASSAAATRRAAPSVSALSHTKPVAPISAAEASMASRERDETATRAPSATSAAAMPRPIP